MPFENGLKYAGVREEKVVRQLEKTEEGGDVDLEGGSGRAPLAEVYLPPLWICSPSCRDVLPSLQGTGT